MIRFSVGTRSPCLKTLAKRLCFFEAKQIFGEPDSASVCFCPGFRGSSTLFSVSSFSVLLASVSLVAQFVSLFCTHCFKAVLPTSTKRQENPLAVVSAFRGCFSALESLVAAARFPLRWSPCLPTALCSASTSEMKSAFSAGR